MEYLIFTKACLSYVRVIMALMRISLVELLRQAVMGHIPVVEYMLLDVHGLLWLRSIVPGA
jgi:hypothetical protein